MTSVQLKRLSFANGQVQSELACARALGTCRAVRAVVGGGLASHQDTETDERGRCLAHFPKTEISRLTTYAYRSSMVSCLRL